MFVASLPERHIYFICQLAETPWVNELKNHNSALLGQFNI